MLISVTRPLGRTKTAPSGGGPWGVQYEFQAILARKTLPLEEWRQLLRGRNTTAIANGSRLRTNALGAAALVHPATAGEAPLAVGAGEVPIHPAALWGMPQAVRMLVWPTEGAGSHWQTLALFCARREQRVLCIARHYGSVNGPMCPISEATKTQVRCRPTSL